MLAIADPALGDQLDDFAARTAAEVRQKDANLQQLLDSERSKRAASSGGG
jgi:hypothetical protein